MRNFKHLLAVALTAILVAACGGGGGSSLSGGASGVRVFGDSLADSGTFGIKFTVNAAGSSPGTTPTSTPIWPELIAKSFGKQVCNFYVATSFTNFVAPALACTNYAVGGGRINSLAATGGPTSPFSIPAQMDNAAAAVGGTFPAGEVMLLVGGGNDAADLVGAYLGAGGGGAGLNTYIGFLSSVLPAASVTSMIGNAGGAEALAGMYMVGLANRFADAVNTKLLARGATRVAVLNAPAVTNTPRFKLVLGDVARRTNAATAAQVESLARAWTVAFNTQLTARLGSESRVAIVDFFTAFNDQVSQPASFALTNVTTPVCPITGLDSSGLPDYNFFTCTAAALDVSGPVGWRSYAFSDGFHPTPFGHQLLAQLVSRSLAQKGWL